MACSSLYELRNWYIDGLPKIIMCVETGKHSKHRCDGYSWATSDEYKENNKLDVIYTPMSIDGESGYFLSDEEYHKLYTAATGRNQSKYIQELEDTVANFRHVIENAHDVVSTLRYDLGNAQ